MARRNIWRELQTHELDRIQIRAASEFAVNLDAVDQDNADQWDSRVDNDDFMEGIEAGAMRANLGEEFDDY
jgi:hypothetical protein